MLTMHAKVYRIVYFRRGRYQRLVYLLCCGLCNQDSEMEVSAGVQKIQRIITRNAREHVMIRRQKSTVADLDLESEPVTR